MGKTVYVASNAAGAILKASRRWETCDAYIKGCLGGTPHMEEPNYTPSGDPVTLFKVAADNVEERPAYKTAYALTTLRLS